MGLQALHFRICPHGRKGLAEGFRRISARKPGIGIARILFGEFLQQEVSLCSAPLIGHHQGEKNSPCQIVWIFFDYRPGNTFGLGMGAT